MENTLSMKNQSQKGIKLLDIVFLMAVLVFLLLPSVQLIVKFYTILAVAIAFVGAYTLFTGEQYPLKILMGAFGLTLLFFALGDVSNLTDMISKFYYYFIMCFPALLLYWFLPKSTKNQRIFLLLFIFLLYILVLRNTYQELLINENVTRSFDNALEVNADNVGTYDFVYATAALLPFLGVLISEVNSLWKKILFAVLALFLLNFLLLAQYTIALLAAAISLMCVPILKAKKRETKLLCLILMACVLVCCPIFLKFLAERVPSEQMSIRLSEVVNFLSESDSSGYNLNGRLTLYRRALQAFAAHPLTGNRVLTFDSHSTILAVMARTGIWGILIYAYMLRKMKRKTCILINKSRDGWSYFTPVFVYLIIVGLTNPIHSAIITNTVVWFVTPLGFTLLEKGES